MIDNTLLASRYRVLRELGRGGMGVVYIVEHIHTGDHLALKLLLGNGAKDAKAVERFKREARASARIKSEHVVKVVDADIAPELDGAPFLVMELLNGSDLQKRLETGGALAPGETIHYLTQAATALDRSHASGIIHRDLKPENLFLHTREDGTTILKILDFGISKLVGGDGGNDIAGAGATKTGAIMGTPLYMSPEQARGRVNDIGPASDVWAMGLIGLQLLTGEIYWRANTVAELMSQILAEPFYSVVTRWPWLSPAVDTWFLRSCAREPSARFSSVGEQVAALAHALGVGTSEALGRYASAPVTPALSVVAGDHVAPARPLVHTTMGAASQSIASTLVKPRTGAVLVIASLVVIALGASGYVLRGRGPEPRASSSAALVPEPSLPPLPPPPSPSPVSSTPVPGPSSLSSAQPPPSPSPPMMHAGVHSHPGTPVPMASTTGSSANPPPPRPSATRFDPSTL